MAGLQYLAVPMRKHLFQDLEYTQYAKQIWQDVWIPWWVQMNRLNRFKSTLFRGELPYRANCYRTIGIHQPTPTKCHICMYVLKMPFRMLVAVVRLVVEPLLYPSFFWFCRELVQFPWQRNVLRRLKTEGIRNVAGRIVRHEHGSLALRINADESSAQSLEYVFRNSRSEPEEMLGVAYQDLKIGQTFELTLLPWDSMEEFVAHLCVGHEKREIFDIWTDHRLTNQRGCVPAFSWQSSVLAIVASFLSLSLNIFVFCDVPTYYYYKYLGDLDDGVSLLGLVYVFGTTWSLQFGVALGHISYFHRLSYWGPDPFLVVADEEA